MATIFTVAATDQTREFTNNYSWNHDDDDDDDQQKVGKKGLSTLETMALRTLTTVDLFYFIMCEVARMDRDSSK